MKLVCENLPDGASAELEPAVTKRLVGYSVPPWWKFWADPEPIWEYRKSESLYQVNVTLPVASAGGVDGVTISLRPEETE